MLYKISKKIFAALIDFLHFMQVVFIFLSFFVILYWILELAGVGFVQPFAPFFETIRAITHLFYTRVVVMNGTTIDFSFLMATCTFLLIVWLLKVLVEYIQVIEEKYDKAYRKLKNIDEELFNKKLEEEYLKLEYRNNKFLIMIKFNVINLRKNNFLAKNPSEGVTEKENEVLFDFFELLEDFFESKKEILDEGILLCFDNFNNVNKILKALNSGVLDLKNKYAIDGWQVNFIMGAEVYAEDSEFELKKRQLIVLMNTGMENEILCLATFKERYSLVKNQDFQMQGKGFYQIFDENQEVFCIKSSK